MTIPRYSPQARTSARPASVRPGPWSGEPGKPNGTPVANALRRFHTSPSERRPAACRTSSSSRPVPIGSAPSRCSTAASPSPSRVPVAAEGEDSVSSSTRRAIRSRPPEARSIRCSSATWASPSRSARSSGGTGWRWARSDVGVVRRGGGEDREARRRRGRRARPAGGRGGRRRRRRGSRSIAPAPAASTRERTSLCPSKTLTGRAPTPSAARSRRRASARRAGGRARLSRARAAVASCSAVSTPSATTSRPSAWPSATTARTIARRRSSRPSAGDERAVDLEHVDREPPQVGERRVPGPEVVERAAARPSSLAARRARRGGSASSSAARSR